MASTSDWALLKWDPPLRERSRRAENDRPTASPGRIRTKGNVRFHQPIALHHPRNETQALSLMSRNRVKSGTAFRRVFKSTCDRRPNGQRQPRSLSDRCFSFEISSLRC